jgi:phage N-6-adenine-methyltransferase
VTQPLLIPSQQIDCPPPDPSGRDAWSSPWPLVRYLAKRYAGGRFDLDVCASAYNAKAPLYLTIEEDALKTPWDGTAARGDLFDGQWRPSNVWFQPPYNPALLEAMVERALEQTLEHQLTTVGLLPVRSDRAWFRRLMEPIKDLKTEVEFLEGRVPFDRPPQLTEDDESSNREPSFVVVIRPVVPRVSDILRGAW